MEIALVVLGAIALYLFTRASSAPGGTASGAAGLSKLIGGPTSSLPIVGTALSGAESFLTALEGPFSQAGINQSLAQPPIKSSVGSVYGPVAPVSVSAPQFSNPSLTLTSTSGPTSPVIPGLTPGTVNPFTGLGSENIGANIPPPPGLNPVAAFSTLGSGLGSEEDFNNLILAGGDFSSLATPSTDLTYEASA